jgi:hypothetical protein
VAVILVYLSLDLCLASMPGVFVFDAGDSVESTVMSRSRQIPGPAPAPLPTAPPRYERVTARPDTPHEPAWAIRRPRVVTARREAAVTAVDLDASAEDPH